MSADTRLDGVEGTGWSREFLASIVDSSDDAIIGKTLDGTIISWNKGAERIYGYRAEEVLGRGIGILVPADRPDELPAILERLRRGERIDHYHTTRVRKDGAMLSVSVTISPVRDDDGRIIGASAIARDITAQERAVEDALELREQFISVAAHELRTPMTSMYARLQLLERRVAASAIDREQQRRDVALVLGGARRLRLLLERVLDVSRIRLGRLEIDRTPTDLAEIVRTVVAGIAETTERDIRVRAAKGPLQANVDVIRIEEVLTNLLDNASKYSPADAPIEVDVDGIGDAARIAVTDHGPGIPEGERERIFEPFHRASQDRRGVGLGLHIAREIVALHGGTLVAEGAEGGGARFVMTLPRNGRP